MSQGIQYQELLLVGGSALSLCVCAWIVFRELPKLPNSAGKRQLTHLVWADLLMAPFGILLAISDLGIVQESIAEEFCQVREYTIKAAWIFGLHVSTLVECQIAASFTASVQRWQRTLHCSKRVLPWLWCVAFVMTVVSLVFTSPQYNKDYRYCGWDSRMSADLFERLSEPLFTVVFGLATLVNLFMYVVVACKPYVTSVRQPLSVEVRREKQMTRYCVVFVFTWLPYWITVFFFRKHSARLFSGKDLPRLAAALPISLNGVTNVWAYAAHSRRLRRVWDAPDEPNDRGPDDSFHVDFQRSVASIPDMPLPMSVEESSEVF